MRADLFICDRCEARATTGKVDGDELGEQVFPEMPEGWTRVTVDRQKLAETADLHNTLDLCVECGTMLLELVAKRVKQ
jgi:hypothetical protein